MNSTKQNLKELLKKHQQLLRTNDRLTLFFQDEKNNSFSNSDQKFPTVELNDNILNYAQEHVFKILLNNEEPEEEIIIHSLSLLIDIIIYHGRNTLFMNSNDIIYRLIELLYHNNVQIVNLTLNAIFHLSQGSRNPIDLLIENDLLSILYSILEMTDEFGQIFHQKILSIISCIAFLGEEESHTIIEKEFVTWICNFFDFLDINGQISSAFVISNLLMKANVNDFGKIINPKTFSILSQFLDEDYEPRFHRCILDGLLNCVSTLSIENSQFCELFLDQFFLNSIKSLTSSSDERTSVLSQQFLKEISSKHNLKDS
ncbi:hypothetical protein TRFO_11245 [Tritrichomonas foetus]|uniref:Uncharacterized protein n=1 Tax=Tritrichomonas foetus TaxID=1144522 RepID=A0A1J4J931_9EUKA|nr:hypothetical protein TRFO_11245 [Tritrichomonas foetus]|eukprot:OHS94187.1 hypothetical protein TRFO_11245 [Tritrichomonas foetus]